jgi:hypothetical protein
MGRFMSPDPSGLVYADPTNPQSFNLYSYVMNNPLINTDPSGMECVWDDGSYDASDDPDTGSADKCSGQGGNWVPPSIFEGVEGNQAGSWSGQASSSIASDWLTPSAVVDGDTSGISTDSTNMLDSLKAAYCSAVPSGGVASLGGALGGIGSVSGSVDTVKNYNSGQTSLFATGGGMLGWNGGASLTATSGLVYGLDGTNNGYSGQFKGGNLYLPTPIPFVGAGGSITHGNGVTVVSGGVGAALVGRATGGATWTNTTKPLNVGRFAGFTALDFVGYLLRQPCN